jgi:predicted membrane protein
MSRISLVTLTYTILLSIISVLSKGWQVLVFQLTRNQTTNLTIKLASVYLCYSAYFLAQDFTNITKFMKVVMALMYVVIGYRNFQNTKKCIKGLQRVALETLGANPNDVMRESFTLKMQIMK